MKIAQHLLRGLWIAAGVFFLALALAGIILPLLPTTPFLLLAAYCFARGSERLNTWLLSHPKLGPSINNWRNHGAINANAKKLALVFIALTPVVTFLLGAPYWAILAQIALLSVVGFFIMTRPSPPNP